MKVLIACEFSEVVKEQFLLRGHDAHSCDLLPGEKGLPNHHQCDVRELLNDGWDLMIAHPPCTYITVTGNKWFNPEFMTRFPQRVQQRVEAVNFFMILAGAPIERICIENPLGIMSTLWRKPDQIIQPYQFGHIEEKKTCLWLKNLPIIRFGQAIQQAFEDTAIPNFTEIKEPEYVTFASGKRMATWYVEAARNKDTRANIRSRTFPGIAKAMAEQWGNL